MYADSDQRWPAEITLKGGQKVFFESPKHAFAYYLSVGEYAKGRKQTDVEAFTVRDWQTGKQVDARKYWYLVGSDIEGPMGADIVPLSEDGLKKLQATHKGERHQFNSVTREVLKKLDQAGSEACCEGHAR
jgi:nitrous oxide reductase accessory protein NosL